MIAPFLCGIMIIFLGIEVILFGEIGGKNIYYNIEPVKWSSGLIFIGLGCLFILLSFYEGVKKYKNRHKQNDKPLICPTCMNHYYENEMKTLKCPNCKEPLITLSEYVENKKYRKEDDVSK